MKKIHYNPRMRYTEIYLAYAEAANEAYGPTNTGGHSYSAYDVMKALRSRAGIKNDAYLEECKGNQEKMQQLIRNVRRSNSASKGSAFGIYVVGKHLSTKPFVVMTPLPERNLMWKNVSIKIICTMVPYRIAKL